MDVVRAVVAGAKASTPVAATIATMAAAKVFIMYLTDMYII